MLVYWLVFIILLITNWLLILFKFELVPLSPAKLKYARLKLVECKSEKPKFLCDPNSYLAIGGGGWGAWGVQKTQTETTEDPNGNNISFFCILINFHHSDHSANHQKLNVIQK